MKIDFKNLNACNHGSEDMGVFCFDGKTDGKRELKMFVWKTGLEGFGRDGKYRGKIQ